MTVPSDGQLYFSCKHSGERRVCRMLDNLISPTHLLFLLGLALLIFGPKRIPEIGSAIGRGIRDFRQAMSNFDANAPKSDGEESNTTKS